MGVIYSALSPQLAKRVAIKVLIKGEFASEEARDRFHVEARAAARLRHPNIVGTHEVGEERGRLYLVMDLIEGESLQKRVSRDGPLLPDQAARIAQRLAEAVYYAHTRSILHRDIKPANVLITPEGEPVLTDFGLAKEVGSDQTGVTESGQVMGTPAYMPPEQAMGALDRIDRRSDVYSLGATLYEALTGVPPFDAPTTMEVLKAVLESDPVPPSQLRPGLDPELETICLTCLEKEPEQRYDSAKELADDLARHLSDEPIVARPPSIADRARKWFRRNRKLARTLGISAGVALWVMVLGSAFFLVQLRRERDTAEQARLEADAAAAEARHQADRARDRAEIARAAVKVLVFEVREKLGDLPGERVRHAREVLLQSAVEQLLRLLEAESADAPLSFAAAEAYRQIGDLALEAGSSQRAADVYSKAVALDRALLAVTPGPQAERDLGTSLLKLGEVRWLQGDRVASAAVYRSARKHLEAALAREPHVPTSRLLAQAVQRIGKSHREAGDLPTSLEAFKRATALLRGLCKRDASDQRAARELSLTLLQTSEVFQQQGHQDKANAALEEALRIARSLAAAQPESLLARRTLAHALDRAGATRLAQGQLASSLESLSDALRVRRELLAQDPRSAAAQRELARALDALGDARRAAQDPLGAMKAHAEALAILRRLRKLDPNNADLRRDESSCLSRLGHVRQALGKLEEALEAHEEAVAIHREILAAQRSATAIEDLAGSMRLLAVTHRAQGHLSAALKVFGEALALQRDLLARAPTSAAARRSLTRCLLEIAALRWEMGDLSVAQVELEQAAGHLRILQGQDASNVRLLGELSETLTRLGDALRAAGDLPAAFVRYRQALRYYRLLVKHAPQFEERLAGFQALLRRRKWEELLVQERRQPESSDEHLLLANHLCRKQRFGEAVPHFQRALIDPDLRQNLKLSVLYSAVRAASRASASSRGVEAVKARGLALTWLAEDLRLRLVELRSLDARLAVRDPKRKLPPKRRAALEISRRSYVVHFLRARDTDPALKPLRALPEFGRLFLPLDLPPPG